MAKSQEEEMLQNLDLLLDMEAVEAEEQWDVITNMDEAESAPVEEEDVPAEEG